jgi:hypothetical protein
MRRKLGLDELLPIQLWHIAGGLLQSYRHVMARDEAGWPITC